MRQKHRRSQFKDEIHAMDYLAYAYLQTRAGWQGEGIERCGVWDEQS